MENGSYLHLNPAQVLLVAVVVRPGDGLVELGRGRVMGHLVWVGDGHRVRVGVGHGCGHHGAQEHDLRWREKDEVQYSANFPYDRIVFLHDLKLRQQ